MNKLFLPVSAYLDGQYKGSKMYLRGVPAVVGNQGVTDIIEFPNLNAAEKETLPKISDTIKTSDGIVTTERLVIFN